MSEADAGFQQGQLSFPREQDLDAFAQKFAGRIQAPLIIWLVADLGAGKTTFARALIHALGHQGRVKKSNLRTAGAIPAGITAGYSYGPVPDW